MKKLLVALSILLASLPALAAPINVYQIVGPGGLIDPGLLVQYLAQPITLSSPTISGQMLANDGTAALPSYSFTADPTLGLYRNGANQLSVTISGVEGFRFTTGSLIVSRASGQAGNLRLSQTGVTDFTLNNEATTGNMVFAGATNYELRNSTTAQVFRVYNTFTDASNYERGFSRWASNVFEVGAEAAGTGSARNMRIRSGAGVLAIQPTGTGANQVAMLQTTVPTCSGSCGTSPSVVGSDTVMIVTMGSSGVPASPFTVTFNGTWAAAPACSVTSALTTMVVGKMAIAVQPSTTTITVTTNGTAPGVSDKYSIICLGVQ